MPASEDQQGRDAALLRLFALGRWVLYIGGTLFIAAFLCFAWFAEPSTPGNGRLSDKSAVLIIASGTLMSWLLLGYYVLVRKPITAISEEVSFRAPPQTRVSQRGDSLILTHVGGVKAAFMLSFFGLFWLGTLGMIDAEPYFNSSPDFLEGDFLSTMQKLIPFLASPFTFSSCILLALHLVPVACLALAFWAFFVRLHYVISPRGITRHLWFFYRFNKHIPQGRLVLEITSENESVTSIWSWNVHIENGSGKYADFFFDYSDRRESGFQRPALHKEGRSFVRELARITGWPVEYRQRIEAIPVSSSSSSD